MSNKGGSEVEFRQEGVPVISNFSSMYEISGQDPISPHTSERYLRAKALWDKEISRLALEKIEHDKIYNDFSKIPLNDRSDVVRRLFDSTMQTEQILATRLLHYTNISDRAALIRLGLKSSSIDVQTRVASFITIAHERESEINNLKELVAPIIRNNLKSAIPSAQVKAVEMIKYASLKDQASLIREALNCDNADAQLKAAERLESLPQDEREILRALLDQKIRSNLESDDPYKQVKYMQMTRYTNGNAELIMKAFTEGSPEAQLKAAEMMYYDFGKKKASYNKLITQKILTNLECKDLRIQANAVEMIEYAPGNKQAQLYILAKNIAPNAFVSPQFYIGSGITRERFARTQFDKTGSETTLVGGSLKDKIIIRSIRPDAFIVWQSLYENADLWRRNGFDYVPIEPIVSYRLNDQGLVDIFSGVLDLNLEQWKNRGGDRLIELEEDSGKILGTMQKTVFTHNHAHSGNFCLRFYRDENRRVDLNRKPRIYLIDFDLAKSS